ncbi:MAG: stage V sporulation protein AD [Clostridia bacterium]|nr:stage V sporulation protein AD [Clostridia bacterium]
MQKQMGKQTLVFNNVFVKEGFSVAGPKEKHGLLGDCFDFCLDDDKFGEKSFEKAECKMFKFAIDGVLNKANLQPDQIETMLGGDLLNQIVSVSFAMRAYNSSFLGLYNACGTFAESLLVGSCLIDGGYKNNIVCISGSHFSTAERQYRYPLELGVLRSPVTQWTATGSGASILSKDKMGAICQITKGVAGRVVDLGIKDVNNMGAAMAPAACDTIVQFFNDTNEKIQNYDAVFTGDLGKLGKKILTDLLKDNDLCFEDKLFDCGAMLYKQEQQTFQGGSGAACSAIVFNSFILNKFKEKQYKKILLAGTGALLSPLTSFQGESVPCIAHCLEVCSCC